MPRPQLPQDDDFGFIPDITQGTDDFGFIPDTPRQKQPEVDQPWYKDIADQFTIPNAIRFGASALGDLAGGAAALSGWGAPAAAGLVVGGGALGEAGARWWEGKPFDPGITALEGGLNLLPGAAGIPGKGAGLKAIGEYALRSAGKGAEQGLIGAFPRHQAETGNLFSPTQWEMPSAGEFAGQAIGGGVMGGVVGGTLGGAHAKFGKAAPDVVTDTTTTDVSAPPPPIESAPPPPTDGGGPAITASMRARLRGLGISDPQIEMMHPTQAAKIIEDNFGPMPTQAEPPPPTAPPANPFIPPNEQILLSRGYTESDLIDLTPTEIEQLANAARLRPEQPPLSQQVQQPPPPPIRPGTEGAINPGDIPFNGENPTVPTANLIKPGYLDNLRRGGFEIDPTKMGPQTTGLRRIPDEARGGISSAQEGGGISEARDETLGGPMGRVAQFDPRVQPPPVDQTRLHNFTTDIVSQTGPSLEPTGLTIHPVEDNATGPIGIADPRFDKPFVPEQPFGPGDLRARNQLENISNAPRNEPIDLGPQPTPESMMPPGGGISETRGPISPDESDPGIKRQWQYAIKRANSLGIDWRQFDDLRELRQAVLERAATKSADLGRPWSGNQVIGDMGRGGVSEAMRPPDWMHRFGAGETVPREASNEMIDRMTLLKREQDAAYRAGDTKRAVELGQVIGELDSLLNRQSSFDREALGGAERKRPTQKRSFLSEATGIPEDEFIRMELGEREAILRNMVGTYAEHGARVANKELLQNAIDATQSGGNVSVKLDYTGTGNEGPSITVTDLGPGLPIDLIRNEYVTLTGSGKRGKPSETGRLSIGEMGVGKATYLLGTDSFKVSTIAIEPDGTTWKYDFQGNPDDMITGKIRVNKQQMPDGTQTGTKVQVFDKSVENIQAAEDYLSIFAGYSDTPVTVNIKSNKNPNVSWHNGMNRTVSPRTSNIGQIVHQGSLEGGDYTIFVPDNATWMDDTNHVTAILNARGMFQGAQTIFPGGRGRLPDRVVVNIEPTVSAQDAKRYPLTSPTREQMKDKFGEGITKVIKKHLMEEAEKKREADIQSAFDALVPRPNPMNPRQNLGFITNDRGGRYTPDEMARFEGNPRIQAIGGEMKKMLDRLNSLFPTEQLSRTTKFGFDLGDDVHGGININPPNNPNENVLMVNILGAMKKAGDRPMIAAERIAHTILHEFNHNIVRQEGGTFTWQLIQTDSAFGTRNRADVADTIHRLITGPDGKYAPDVQRLLQEYTAARGRRDTTVDFIARQAQGRFAQEPQGPGGVPNGNRNAGGGTSAAGGGGGVVPPGGGGTTTGGGGAGEPPKGRWQRLKEATGWGQGATRIEKPKEKEYNFITEALSVPTGATTMLDFSAPGRQGLSMILTPQFWSAAGKMFKGLSAESFKRMDADLKSKPMFQRRILADGSVDKSMAEKIGTKIFSPASELGPRAEGAASRWLETGGSIPVLSSIYKHTVGYPIRATNRAYITFLNHLNVNRTEYLLNRARDMAIKGMDTGNVRPGLFSKSVTPEQAAELNPYHNIQLGKEIADFVNTATGHGPLKTHILPFKQTEVSLEHASKTLGRVLFSPGLLASRIRMLNPSTYVMASPYVRKQYLKAAVSTAGAWFAFTELAKLAGGDDVQVSNDPTSADFGKVRIGDTRLDAAGGFQQFLVAFARSMAGGATSSSTGQFHPFGEGYQAQTQEDMMQRFMVNKLNPTAKFAYDIANASQYNPFHLGDRTLQMFIPLIAQDMQEMAKNNPELLPWMVPAAFGMGTQTYSKGESVGKLIAPENDILISGGIPANNLGGLRP